MSVTRRRRPPARRRHRQPPPRGAPLLAHALGPRPRPPLLREPDVPRRPARRPAPRYDALLSPAAPPTSRWPTSPATANSGASIFAVSPATLIPRARLGNPDRGGTRRLRPPRPAAAHPRPRHRHRLPAARGAARIPGRVRRRRRPVARGRGPGAAQRRHARAGRPRPPSCAPTGQRPLATALRPVLCNPPYIPTGDIAGLMPEVARHEPAGALDGGRDGLAAYRRIIPLLPRCCGRTAVAVLELGTGQAPRGGTGGDGRPCATTRPDLAGIPRALVLQSAGGARKNRLARRLASG